MSQIPHFGSIRRTQPSLQSVNTWPRSLCCDNYLWCALLWHSQCWVTLGAHFLTNDVASQRHAKSSFSFVSNLSPPRCLQDFVDCAIEDAWSILLCKLMHNYPQVLICWNLRGAFMCRRALFTLRPSRMLRKCVSNTPVLKCNVDYDLWCDRNQRLVQTMLEHTVNV